MLKSHTGFGIISCFRFLSVGHDQLPSLSTSIKPEKFFITTTITSLFSQMIKTLAFQSMAHEVN
jgi:hypothetical protein